MPSKSVSHVIGFDDAPFERVYRGDVLVVGAVYAGRRFEGVLSTKVRRDGANATRALAARVAESRFAEHLQAVFLQGIALAGFNVIDIHALHESLAIPVLVVCRKQPDFASIEKALLEKVPGGRRKWALIEKAGPMEKLAGVYVQRVGIAPGDAARAIERFSFNAKLPEPLRSAHLIAGGVVAGESRQRA